MNERVRVLHLVCGLGGGGSERWLRDIVRLSPDTVDHKVVPVYADGIDDFVYDDDLRALSAYARPWALPPWVPRPLVGRLRSVLSRNNAVHLLARAAAWMPALVRAIRLTRRFRPHVIHSHTPADLLVSLAVSALFRVPLVHTVSCLFSQMRGSGYGWMPAIYGKIHPAVSRFSTGQGRAELEAVGVPAEKILYDLGGVDVDAAQVAVLHRETHRSAVRRQLRLPANCPLALTVGRLHPSKGHGLGLEAIPRMLEQLPDLHWVILGEGEERESLEARAVELGVAERVHLLGFVRELRPYHAAADVYLHTSLFEPENLAYYDAMAMGLPIVAFDTGERPDLLLIVGHGVQAPRNDISGFARATVSLLEMEDRGRSLGARGAAHARQHLDIRCSVARLSSIYRELARLPAAGDGANLSALTRLTRGLTGQGEGFIR